MSATAPTLLIGNRNLDLLARSVRDVPLAGLCDLAVQDSARIYHQLQVPIYGGWLVLSSSTGASAPGSYVNIRHLTSGDVLRVPHRSGCERGAVRRCPKASNAFTDAATCTLSPSVVTEGCRCCDPPEIGTFHARPRSSANRIRVRAGGLCGDARACAPAHFRARARRPLFGAEDVEAARFGPAKPQIASRRFACAASVSVDGRSSSYPWSPTPRWQSPEH